jgi:DNA (cytosine-5)-methyltransferase 1
MKPRLLDLFSGAGGAARGYQRAGFHVTGVDIRPQPHYAGDEFIQADAMTYPLEGFDAIHASPPCQQPLDRSLTAVVPSITKDLTA